jgi:hypothetical protein
MKGQHVVGWLMAEAWEYCDSACKRRRDATRIGWSVMNITENVKDMVRKMTRAKSGMMLFRLE